jgi:hypothetical protein
MTRRAGALPLLAAFIVASLDTALAFQASSPFERGRIASTPQCATGLELRAISGGSDNDNDIHDNTNLISVNNRRQALIQGSMVGGLAFLSSFGGIFSPEPALAASKKEEAEQMEVDKQKVLAGYKRLNYLLDNWAKETTVCGKRGGNDRFDDGCDRTPEKVMEYLGSKSMNDPLFKAEKRLFRLQALVPDSDTDAQARYQEALETFSEKSDEGTGMAFVSSWGESNPGGGKDRVELFIERSKKNVIDVRESLKTMIEILRLEQSEQS